MEKKGKNKNFKNKKTESKIGKMDSASIYQLVKRAYLVFKMDTNVHAMCPFTNKIGARNILIHNAAVHFAYFANYILH